MAEFGISATQLSEPQGSGARPISPVETMNIGPNPLFKIAGDVADVFAKGLQVDRKQQANALKDSVIKSYYDEVNKITAGVEQGAIKPAEASVRSRDLLSRFLAQNPGLTGELREAANTLTTFSTLGTIENQVQAERDQRRKQLAEAEKLGLVLSPDASPEEEDAIIKAYALETRNDKEFQRMSERKRFDTAMAAEDRAAFEFQDKENSFRMVNEAAGARIEQFDQYSQGLRRAVASGKLTLEDARAQLSSQGAQIRATLQAASRLNPQFASAYSKIFEDMQAVQLQLLDPQKNADDLLAQFKTMKVRAVMAAATADPKTLAAFAVADFMPNSPSLQIQMGSEGIKAYNFISTTPPDKYVPTAIGTGDAKLEKDVVTAFRENMKGLGRTSEERKTVAELQAGNSAAHILTQTGEAIDKGQLSVETMLGVVSSIAEPGFYQLVSQGKIPATSLNQGTKAIQIMFNQTERDVMNKLTAPVMTPDTGAVFNRTQARTAKPPVAEGKEKKLIDIVDMKSGPNGVSFVMKDAGKTPQEQQYNRELMADLTRVERVVNTAIRAAAHLGGTNDYKSYWEQNKHQILPSIFKAPTEKAPKFDTEAEVKDGLASVMATSIPAEEKKQIQEVLKKALERNDLSAQARKDIERDLERFK